MKKEFKDTLEDVKLAIKDSAKIAIAETKALGLPVTYQRGTEIVKEYADGSIEVIGKAREAIKGYTIGQKLYVRKEN